MTAKGCKGIHFRTLIYVKSKWNPFSFALKLNSALGSLTRWLTFTLWGLSQEILSYRLSHKFPLFRDFQQQNSIVNQTVTTAKVRATTINGFLPLFRQQLKSCAVELRGLRFEEECQVFLQVTHSAYRIPRSNAPTIWTTKRKRAHFSSSWRNFANQSLP